MGKSIPEYKQPPSYLQICRRTNKLDMDIKGGADNDMMLLSLPLQRTVQVSRLQIEVSMDAR